MNNQFELHCSFLCPGDIGFELRKNEYDHHTVTLEHRGENNRFVIHLDRVQLQQLLGVLQKADDDWDNIFPEKKSKEW